MKQSLLLVIFFVGWLNANSQSRIVVLMGRVLDNNQNGIAFAGIQNLNLLTGVNADENGFYTFKTQLPASIKISALGFYSQTRFVSPPTIIDTLEINFSLDAETFPLQSVNIFADNAPYKIVDAVNLVDFELKNNLVWLLYNNKSGSKIEIIDSIEKPIADLNSGLQFDNLSKTQHDFIYTIYKDSAYIFNYQNNSLTDFSMSEKVFRSQALAIVGYKNRVYYYERKDSSQAKFSFWYYSGKDTVQKKLYSYFNREKYYANVETNNELKYLQGQLDYSKGIGDENAAQYPNQGGSIWARINALSTMIQPVFCPLRFVRDSIYIFNFDNDSIYVFDKQNNFIRKMFLSFDQFGLQFKNKDIIVDEEGLQCYFNYVVNGISYLDKIDLNNGEKKNSQVLTGFPFIETIRISNGAAYFCYLDRSTANSRRSIYKIQLN